MQSIAIAPTRTTPEVRFDRALDCLFITGQSYPENSFDFYDPVIQWINDHLDENSSSSFTVEFRLDYFNTSSSKCLLDMLETLETQHLKYPRIKVIWNFEEGDEDMEDSGHDFKEDLDLPFELKSFLPS